MQNIDLPLLAGQAGLGAVLGVAVGYTTKKALKLSLILIALALVAALILNERGFITIHWETLEQMYNQHIQGKADSWTKELIHWFSSSIAVAGSFAGGFFIGFRYG
ncbi:MAG: FUN14 domain-containing protein [Limnochordia bacterium]|jgi:uncharacterized membrane protein (Fun14 family)